MTRVSLPPAFETRWRQAIFELVAHDSGFYFFPFEHGTWLMSDYDVAMAQYGELPFMLRRVLK